jgi:hypothetical protein
MFRLKKQGQASKSLKTIDLRVNIEKVQQNDLSYYYDYTIYWDCNA